MSWSSGMSITRGLEAGAELNVFQEWNMVGKAIWEFVGGPGFVREERIWWTRESGSSSGRLVLPSQVKETCQRV